MTRTNSAAEEKLAIVFFFNDTATTEIYTLSLHDALPILELHQEAGFHPIKVVQHATGNNARILGQEGRLGRVRAGYAADIIVVDGNPLEAFKVLYPGGTYVLRNGRVARSRGVEWTIKDGIPYHGPTLLREVKEIVARARAERDAARAAGNNPGGRE